MKKTIVVYFSRTGNNKFIAEKLSKQINGDLDVIVPKMKNLFILVFFSLFKISAAINPLIINLKEYDRVVLLGPIWIGSFISPLRGFVKKYKDNIRELIFITVCGSGSEDREGKFGYEGVFKEIKKLLPNLHLSCYEISTKNLINKEKSSSEEVILSDELFVDQIKTRFLEIVKILS